MKGFWLAALCTTLTFVNAVSMVVAADIVKVDGSSTVFPISEGVAEKFQKSAGGIKVTVGVSGTGGGFKKFGRGEIDMTGASRPILTKEIEECKKNGIEYIELPVAFDALTVVINPQNTWAKTMTVAELKTMWEQTAQGKILKWNQVNPAWPDAEFKLFGPGTDSGTFDYFTEAINHKAKSSRGDFTASEDDNVLVTGVSGNKNALGYFGFAYYIENKNKLTAVGVDGGKGPVLPSEETVKGGTYSPLARPIFIYVNKKSLDRPEVVKFAEFYLANSAKVAKDVRYVALPDTVYVACQERLSAKKTGSAFGGVPEVGLHIEELMKKELKN